jgi:hypothetical protein
MIVWWRRPTSTFKEPEALIGRCEPFTWRVRWGRRRQFCRSSWGERQTSDGAERIGAGATVIRDPRGKRLAT